MVQLPGGKLSITLPVSKFNFRSFHVKKYLSVCLSTDNVGPHMRLRGGVEFVKEIPRNANGKILRKDLRNWTKSKL